MNTLIAFAGKYGCTEKCAELVAKRLGRDVDMINLKEIKTANVDKYEKVIIGSSLYYGKIHKEAAEFCISHLDLLKGKKTGLFVCGMQKDTAETAISQNFPEELIQKAQAGEFFGGEFNLDKMGFMEKMIVKKIAKTTTNVSEIREDNIDRFVKAMNS